MRVLIPSPLRSYTKDLSEVEGSGSTLREVLAFLDAAHPGIRFRMIDEQDRIREHIRLFVGEEMARGIDHPVREGQEVQIVCAISGG